MQEQLISAVELKRLQALCAQYFTDREGRLAFLSAVAGRLISSAKELTQEEIQAVFRYFKVPAQSESEAKNYAYFDKGNRQHRTVLSLALQLGWVSPQNPDHADLERLGRWLASPRSPVRKPLKKMNPKELSKIISALENIILKSLSF